MNVSVSCSLLWANRFHHTNKTLFDSNVKNHLLPGVKRISVLELNICTCRKFKNIRLVSLIHQNMGGFIFACGNAAAFLQSVFEKTWMVWHNIPETLILLQKLFGVWIIQPQGYKVTTIACIFPWKRKVNSASRGVIVRCLNKTLLERKYKGCYGSLSNGSPVVPFNVLSRWSDFWAGSQICGTWNFRKLCKRMWMTKTLTNAHSKQNCTGAPPTDKVLHYSIKRLSFAGLMYLAS